MTRPRTVRFALAVLAGLCLSAEGLPGQVPGSQQILVLYQERPTVPTAALNEGFMRAVRSDSSIHREVFFEYLDHARSADPAFQAQQLAFLRSKYGKRSIDVAIAIGEVPYRNLTDPMLSIAPGAEVIFWIDESDSEVWRDAGHAAGGIVTHYDIAGTAQDILNLLPNTRKLLVVSGVTALDSAVLRQGTRELQAFRSVVEIEEIIGATRRQFLERVATLPPHSAILFLNFIGDSLGNKYMPADIVTAASAQSTAPIFAVTRTLLGRGAVGGRLLDHKDHGRQLGELTLEVLAGHHSLSAVRHLPSHRPVFDARALRRWDIDTKRLPQGAEVLYQNAVPWDLHRRRILAVLTICMLEALLIGTLLVQRRRRARAEQLLADRLHFETILADASRTFSNVQPIHIALETGRWLRRLCAAAEARQTAILLFDGLQIRKAGQWCGNNATDPVIGRIGIDAIVDIKNGRVTTIPVTNQRTGPVLVLIPISVEGSSLGILLIEATTVRLFGASVPLDRSRLLGEILGGAIARKTAAEELAKQADALRAAHVEYRRLADSLVEVQENERKRIARELHDDITQRLTMLSMEAGEIGRCVGDAAIVPRSAIEHLTSELGTLVKDVSRVSHRLHPSLLDKIGLPAAVRALCCDNSTGSGTPITFEEYDLPQIVPAAPSLALYRIAQEAIRNAIRHSNARLIAVRLWGIDAKLILEVKDNGRGLDADQIRRGQGLGITSMAERVQALDGSFSVQSINGGGTLVRASIRLANHAADTVMTDHGIEAVPR